jgi:hypothetical protein
MTILQIVPRSPGSPDGIGDYALTVARKLLAAYGHKTIFAAHESAFRTAVGDFEIVPLASLATNGLLRREHDHVILHFVNYGYQKRGVPFRLLPILRGLRTQCRGSWLTIFHELYASGPPWKSAFWLRPFQIQIAKSISRMSDACIVSSEASRGQLKQLTPNARISVHPVISNFGEPALSAEQIIHRDPHRWVICGGTALVERSLRSFRGILNQIPDFFSPRDLSVLGGNDNPATRSLLVDLGDIQPDYRPQISAAEASQILCTASFAWIDYFHRPDVPTAVALKSTAFAAACAHAVVPVFPHRGSAISLHGDRLPGPYFIDERQSELPQDRAAIASEIYAWYQRRASSEHLVRGIASALGLAAGDIVPKIDEAFS